jgi:hypothetical protein
MNSSNVQLVAALAQEVEVTDPIDWGMLAINESDAYLTMAASIIEQFPDQPVEIQAVITKLTVENFVLNLKLLQR